MRIVKSTLLIKYGINVKSFMFTLTELVECCLFDFNAHFYFRNESLNLFN